MSVLALTGMLVVLALLDSTTAGTFVIPVWLMLAPGRLRWQRLGLYLGTVAAGYFLIGLVLLWGAQALLTRYQQALVSSTSFLIQLIVGITVVIAAVVMSLPTVRAGSRRRAQARAARGAGVFGVVHRARTLATEAGSPRALVMLAVLAVGIEVLTLLPYLTGVGLLAQWGPGGVFSLLMLAGYCVVMVAPASLLAVVRIAAHDHLAEPLRWIEDRASHVSASSWWFAGLLGAVVALNAARVLWW